MYINIIDIPNFIESSQDKMNPESENQISREVDGEAVEMCPKVTHTCEGPSENSMEVTESADALPPQLVVLQEEVKSVEEPNVVVSPEESRPPEVTIESVIIPLETLVSPDGESTSLCSTEHLAVEREQRENPEPSAFMDLEAAPAVESQVKDGLCQEGRSVKLSSETESSSSSAADTSKAHVSSSPALSSDLPSHDMLHSYPSTPNASVANILPTTYISVTPKIGMGKPAITKRKFSPGRPRSRQVW